MLAVPNPPLGWLGPIKKLTNSESEDLTKGFIDWLLTGNQHRKVLPARVVREPAQ